MPKRFPSLTIISILSALALWFLAVLEKEHNLAIKIKIKIENIPPSLFLLKQSAKEITCELRGKGRDFLNNQKYLKEYKLDFEEIFKKPIERFPYRFRLYIDLEKLKNIKDLQLLSYYPNYLEIEIDKITEKEIRIKPIFKEEREDYFLINISEEKIKVKGPKSELDFLKEISTESLNLKKLKIAFDSSKNIYYAEGKVFLINPAKEFFSFEKEEVNLKFYFAKIIEKEFKNIPVILITNLKTKITPKTCHILVSGPENILDTLQKKDIKVIINVANLTKGKYKIPAEILLPKQVSFKKCFPEKFEVEVF
ncbi:MAG: CdaR family protein [candidate division WOR-3 bacterium]|uniref:YbbR-like domain-containing protein n=1 Tax=candidate division WOR-3 bacterium TaxID=2052148 RepID=A0A7C4S1W4_UNCW3